jgi:hypothetical protein
VHPGRRRCTGRRAQGAGRPGRRVPGVDPVVGRPAAQLPAAWHASAGAGDRRRCARVLGGAAGGVSRDPRAAGLGAYGDERLGRLPTSAQPAARKALAQICDAEDRDHAETAVSAFAELFGATYPKAVAAVVEDAEQLLALYDFPAEHWCTSRRPTRSRCCTRVAGRGAASPAQPHRRQSRSESEADRFTRRPDPLSCRGFGCSPKPRGCSSPYRSRSVPRCRRRVA